MCCGMSMKCMFRPFGTMACMTRYGRPLLCSYLSGESPTCQHLPLLLPLLFHSWLEQHVLMLFAAWETCLAVPTNFAVEQTAGGQLSTAAMEVASFLYLLQVAYQVAYQVRGITFVGNEQVPRPQSA